MESIAKPRQSRARRVSHGQRPSVKRGAGVRAPPESHNICAVTGVLQLPLMLKWARLRLRRLFASQFRAAKGVSVTSVVNCPRVDLTVARRFWYNSRCSAPRGAEHWISRVGRVKKSSPNCEHGRHWMRCHFPLAEFNCNREGKRGKSLCTRKRRSYVSSD